MILLEDFYAALRSNKDGYTLIKNFLSEQDHKKCLDIACNLEQTEDDNYDSKKFTPEKLLGKDHFFSKVDVQEIGRIYGLENVDEFSWRITKDYPEFHNTFHTDVHYNKNTVTLQWYLDMDDKSRTLHVTDVGKIPFDKWNNNNDIEKLDTSANSMVAFRASPRTHHGFKAGIGYRYNVRLRLKEHLKKETVVHHYNENEKLCWFIDAKDMEVESYPTSDDFYVPEDGTLEEYLAKFTYDSLIANEQGNIIVSDKIKEYPKTLQYLKDQGFEKCVIVFAGACVTQDTINYVYNNTDDFPVYGQIDNDDNKFYRKVTIINLNQVNLDLAQGTGKYLSSYVSNAKNINHKFDLNCYYVHPEHDTYRSLFDLSRYSDKIDNSRLQKYTELNDKDKNTIIQMSIYYRENILNYYPKASINIIST